MSFKFTSALAALAIAAAVIAPASAGTGPRGASVTYSVDVSYADLDLSQQKDVKRLNARLKRALDRVCGRTSSSASQTMRREIRACRADARSRAIASIQAPVVLAAVQTGKWG